MSASLVGSEMCIRDRPSRVEYLYPAPVAGRRQNRRPTPPGRGRVRGGTCLLYTSDAADDM
eukprot:12475560-Alexandrium_andersonii.AAC.1